jgi:DNA polymerase-3 subunit epsilon
MLVNCSLFSYLTAGAPDFVRRSRPDRLWQPFRAKMLQDTTDLAAMAETLSRSPDYRVLRRLVPRPAAQPTIAADVPEGEGRPRVWHVRT